jgi:hypothetical protein
MPSGGTYTATCTYRKMHFTHFNEFLHFLPTFTIRVVVGDALRCWDSLVVKHACRDNAGCTSSSQTMVMHTNHIERCVYTRQFARSRGWWVVGRCIKLVELGKVSRLQWLVRRDSAVLHGLILDSTPSFRATPLVSSLHGFTSTWKKCVSFAIE